MWNSVEFWLALDADKFSKDSCGIIVYTFHLRNSVEFWLALDAHKFQEGIMLKKCVQILVRIHAEKFPLFPGRIYVQFWLASDAHKFSKDLCGKIVHKFQ